MTEEKFNVGPIDDGEDVLTMKIGILAQKTAQDMSREITALCKEHEPEEVGTMAEVQRHWSGMMSLSSYSVAMTHYMLKQINFKWGPESTPHKMKMLIDQVKELAIKFYRAMIEHDKFKAEQEKDNSN